jgi:uncharacterized repeat protein (TIGR01451 family)
MTSSGKNHVRVGYGWGIILLFAFAALLLTATPAWAGNCVADYGGVIDGYVNPVPPAQVQIDGNCTFKNFPASNPLTTNISFYTSPGQNNQRWLVIFDNVDFIGQMSCDKVQGHHIWFVNGSFTTLSQTCQNLFIPEEKIDKQNPAGQTTATIGVPFTYKLTIPVLFDAASGTVINNSGSPNDLHDITVTDDLNASATGADLSYVSHKIYWADDNTPVPHTFSNVGNVLTFSNFPIVPAGRQFVIEITVVLNDTSTNVIGNTFFNTAKWEFGRLIDGVFYEPLPGEWGVTPPLTIAAPQLVMTKSGPATMNLGEWGDFTLDVQNTGLSDAWNVSIRDQLPDGPSGGMCDQTPQIQSMQVFQSDGVTPVPGKGALNQGTDYTLSYSAAPTCRLDITMLTASGTIGPNQRLIIRYRTQLDSDTQDGATLTNIAGAIQWFNGDNSNPDRVAYNRTLTDGTPGIADYQDAHTVTAALTGYFLDKTVEDLTSGANPATTAAPGDMLRYTLRFRTTNQALSNFSIYDEMDALNSGPSFVPGTLKLVTYPGTANISGTNSTGGSKGTGVLDVGNLSLPADSDVVIQFDIQLAKTLTNNTVVANQASAHQSSTVVALSDDPNVNGIASPTVAGDEDPTKVTIVSAPRFVVEKTSTDTTGDPNVLAAGDTLHYTITVKNVGNQDAVNVTLRDLVPANTTYVAGSTTLNGAAVPDSGGLSALVNGMLINSPADPTPGSMPADASTSTANVATINFDVTVNPSVVDGTAVCNQGFVSATDSGIVDFPSDNPNTPIANDATCRVVGNLPLLYAVKTVALLVDNGTPGIVDPGDVLRYTITVQNSGSVAATGVVLTDSVPANTTYVANSTLLNTLPVGQPDNGVSPLASGINISSSDLTPPLPGPGAGTISPGHMATLQYDLQVNAGTPTGTVISNQAVVSTVGLASLLTDGDGDPTNGAQPTVVVVGDAQQLSITKQVSVVGGGAAVPGAQLEYVVRVTNIAAVPAIDVVITDNLDASVPGQLIYVNGSATLDGSTAGISVSGSTITANYAAVNGSLAPGGVTVLRFRATLAPTLVDGTVVTNTGVVNWNVPTQTASASVSLVVGGVPGFAVLNGTAWHDSNFNNVKDSGELPLIGWSVDLYRDGTLLNTVLTDANGNYSFIGVEPNDTTTSRYELRFRSPGAGANTASLGLADSPFTNGPQRISDIVVSTGANVQGLNLPIDPDGVVYNSVSRVPIAGATLTMRNSATNMVLPTDCFDDPAQQGQITLADGYYKFDVNFKDPACPSGGNYLIDVTAPPGTTYIAGTSQIIPPTTDASTAAFSVPSCPGSSSDAIPATTQYCEAQPSDSAPATSVAPRSAGTIYYLHLMLDSSQVPGSSQIFDNHIPLDPDVSGSVVLTKTTPLRNVSRGQLVPYTITLNNSAGLALTDVGIVDRMPPGFTYVKGSALLNGTPTEPTIAPGTLTWSGLTIAGTQVVTIKLLLVVGAGVTEGEYVNRAQAEIVVTGAAISGEATARVRVVPDPTFDCTDIIGKVFNDANRNGRQDEGEEGLQGVRLVTARGLQATTDQYGRYHITCAITPNDSRGSNFVLKLDDRSLPSGFRLSTKQVLVKRVTRGKAMKFNFGASVYRVVAIDLSDAVFEPNSTEIRIQWKPRINVLLNELRKAPSVLRLSYIADTEDEGLVKRRVEAIKKQLTEAWDEGKHSYVLTIEPEIFWRRGAPPKRHDMRRPESR